MKPRVLLSFRLLASLLFSVAALPATAARGVGDFEFTLAAGKVEEICFKLAPSEVVQWRFAADAPVDFNLHWHEGKAVHMPVRREATREDAGRFAAPHAEDYCRGRRWRHRCA